MIFFYMHILVFSRFKFKEIGNLPSSRDTSCLFTTTTSLLGSYFVVPVSFTHPDPGNRAMLSRVSRSNFIDQARIYRKHRSCCRNQSSSQCMVDNGLSSGGARLPREATRSGRTPRISTRCREPPATLSRLST